MNTCQELNNMLWDDITTIATTYATHTHTHTQDNPPHTQTVHCVQAKEACLYWSQHIPINQAAMCPVNWSCNPIQPYTGSQVSTSYRLETGHLNISTWYIEREVSIEQSWWSMALIKCRGFSTFWTSPHPTTRAASHVPGPHTIDSGSHHQSVV